jgi:hypothetical protein
VWRGIDNLKYKRTDGLHSSLQLLTYKVSSVSHGLFQQLFLVRYSHSPIHREQKADYRRRSVRAAANSRPPTTIARTSQTYDGILAGWSPNFTTVDQVQARQENITDFLIRASNLNPFPNQPFHWGGKNLRTPRTRDEPSTILSNIFALIKLALWPDLMCFWSQLQQQPPTEEMIMKTNNTNNKERPWEKSFLFIMINFFAEEWEVNA